MGKHDDIWRQFHPVVMSSNGTWLRVRCRWCTWGHVNGVSANVTRLSHHYNALHRGMAEVQREVSDDEETDPAASQSATIIEDCDASATDSRSITASQLSTSPPYVPPLFSFITSCFLTQLQEAEIDAELPL